MVLLSLLVARTRQTTLGGCDSLPVWPSALYDEFGNLQGVPAEKDLQKLCRYAFDNNVRPMVFVGACVSLLLVYVPVVKQTATEYSYIEKRFILAFTVVLV